MTERSGFWDGAIGDGGPYAMADMHDWFFRMLLNGTGDRGVLKWWLNALEVSGSASPVTIATGAAIIYGLFYESDAATTVSIPTIVLSLPLSPKTRTWLRFGLNRSPSPGPVRGWRPVQTKP